MKMVTYTEEEEENIHHYWFIHVYTPTPKLHFQEQKTKIWNTA